MKKILAIAAMAAAILILAGCPSGTYTVGDILEITVDSDAAELNEDGVLDFGLVQAESETETVSITITNTGEEDISVTSIAIDDENNYTLGLPELPGVIAPGDTTQYSLTFEPMASGDLTATVSMLAQDFPDPAELGVTGEGNYPPEPRYGVTVSGAGITDANGFYERDGFRSAASEVTRGLYTKSGTTDYHIYIYDASDDDIWGLDDSLNADYPEFPLYSAWDAATSLIPPEDSADWAVDDGGVDPPPALIVHDISGDTPFTGETIAANYLYYDEDGDPEAADSALFQWYQADAQSGPYSPMIGETNQTYLTVPADHLKYFKVGIALTAESGITAGEEVLSSPTVQFIFNPPPPID